MRSFTMNALAVAALVMASGCAAIGRSATIVAQPSGVRSAEAHLTSNGRVAGRVCRSLNVTNPDHYDVDIVVRDAAGSVLLTRVARAQAFAGRPDVPNCAGFAAAIGEAGARAATAEVIVRVPRAS